MLESLQGRRYYLQTSETANDRIISSMFAVYQLCCEDCFLFLTVKQPCTISHTRTVVRECFKGDEASQWKRPKFDPSPHQNPSTDLHKNWQA